MPIANERRLRRRCLAAEMAGSVAPLNSSRGLRALSCRNPHSTASAVTMAEIANPIANVEGTIKTDSDCVPTA